MEARTVRLWPEQELFDKSDLVVIGTPIAVTDTNEHGPLPVPGFHDQPVIGVETTFAVIAVLKGAIAGKRVILHHYRPDQMVVTNGPDFVSFDPKLKQRFRLFLVRETDGRYAPVAGQLDFPMSVRPDFTK
jgi:hypothetical protein